MKSFKQFIEIKSYTMDDAWDDFENAVEEAGELADHPILNDFINWVINRAETEGANNAQLIELLKDAAQRVRQQTATLKSEPKASDPWSINRNWN